MRKTNLQYIPWLKEVEKRKTIYILGGLGRPLDNYVFNRSFERNAHTRANAEFIKKHMGVLAYDCNTLMKGFLWEISPGVIRYNNAIDLGARALYNSSREKGPMNTMPDIPGLLVFTADLGHVGVYIGKENGINQYIEATPAWGAWGVTTSADKNHPKGHNRKWALWGKYHLIDYVEVKEKTIDEWALEVLDGKHGDNPGRRQKLGAIYDEVQARVNQISDERKAVSTPADIKVGATVTWSGRLHRNSMGAGPTKAWGPTKGKISILNNAPFGVHIQGKGWISRNQIVSGTSNLHIITRGETLSIIARKYNTTWQKIYNDNKGVIGTNPNLISVGMRLIIK